MVKTNPKHQLHKKKTEDCKSSPTWVRAFVSGICTWVLFLFIGYSHAQQRPNIILILADDMGYHSLGAFGQKLIKTPHLDKLAKNGMVFTDFYANHLCSPSRGSLITGFHTGHGLIRGNHELGAFADSLAHGQMPLQLNMRTLGSELKKAGYATAVMGKWGIGGPNSTGMPHLQGIDLFYGYLDQKQAHNYYPTHLWRNGEKESLPNHYFFPHQKMPEGKDPNDPDSYASYSDKLYSADTIQSETLKFIREHKDKPFFLEMAYTLPHMALQVPDRVLEQYKGKFDDTPYLGERGYMPSQYPRATYAAMITLLDEYVGEVLNLLDAQGLKENTLIIFTADNGAAQVGGCDPDYFDCSGNLRGRKGSLFEGGLKVPFIANWPGVIPAGSSSGHISAIWDLMPTFLDVAGAKPVENINGISFLPTLKQQNSHQKQHTFLYWERHPARREAQNQAVRFGDWKVIREVRSNKISLFNLKRDPGEKENVAERHPELVDQAISYLNTRLLGAIPEWNYTEPTDDY